MLVKRLLGFGRTIARLFHFQICLIYVLVQGNNRKLITINYPLKTWACKSLKGVLGEAYNRNRKSSSKKVTAVRIKIGFHLLVFYKASKSHNKSNYNFITSYYKPEIEGAYIRRAYKYRMNCFVYR